MDWLKVSVLAAKLIFTGLLHAQNQSQPISLNLKNTTLKDFFKQVETKTSFTVVYRDVLIDNTKNVSINASNRPLNEVIKTVLTPKGLQASFRGNTIVVTKGEESKQTVSDVQSLPRTKAITGTVIDADTGEPVIGASVVERGTTNGVITDVDGRFSLVVPENGVLAISYIGYVNQEINTSGNTILDIAIHEDTKSLDEVVVVGYGTQRRADLTTAVSSISGKDLLKAPTMSISNMLGTRVSGISAVQSSGQPGADQADLRVRGQGGIVYVIDGIRRTVEDFNGIDPNEIESVTVLKDASSVAVYGLDANGAFIITTKRGQSDKINIAYTGVVGISQNAEKQRWLDGPEYAYWYNKARVMQGDSEIFTKEMVRKMREGIDGWGNTNWYDKVMGTGTRQHHNLSASGGSEKVRFFTSIGFLDEKGNIDKYNYNRFNLRSNIDANVSKHFTLSLGVSGRIENKDEPRFPADPDAFENVPRQIIWAAPYMQDKYTIGGKEYNVASIGGGKPVSPLGSVLESGYNNKDYSYMQTNFSLTYDAPWLKGLSVKFQGAYDMVYMMSKMLQKPYEVMRANMPDATTTNLIYVRDFGMAKNETLLMETASKRYDLTTQTSINYDNKFGKHNLGILLLSETRERKNKYMSVTGYGLDYIQLDELGKITNIGGDGKPKYATPDGSSVQSRVAGFVGRVNYNYADRYYIEASLRYDGSYLFGGMNRRWVTLPGASVAWRASNEEWFDSSWITNLKLRGGVGKTATSGINAFQWRNTMEVKANSVVVGGTSQSSVYPSTLGNPNLTWAQCLNYNIGLDATFWNGLLGVEADVFYKYEYDKLSRITGSYPLSMGKYYFSTGNVDKADYKGFDLTFTHYNRIGSFNYGAKLLWSYAYGRWLKYAGDAVDAPEYRRLTGKQIGSQLAHLSDGLYQDEKDIEDSPAYVGLAVRPGYIKYKDLNGDGKITLLQDQGYFASSAVPTHTGSANFFANWKGFDLDVLFSWGLGSSIALTGVYTATGSVGIQGATSFSRPFYQGGNSPLFLVQNSWTPDNPEAEFPRLEITVASANNNRASDFWHRSGNYARLKTAQIGYNVPKKWMTSIGVENLRIYVEGFNLFTWSAVTKYNIDPESPAVNNGYYPQQRTYSLGLKLTL